MQNHSSWKISTNIVAGRELYQVYRIINVNEPDHSGNRETRGGLYESRIDAEKLAATLNAEGEKK